MCCYLDDLTSQAVSLNEQCESLLSAEEQTQVDQIEANLPSTGSGDSGVGSGDGSQTPSTAVISGIFVIQILNSRLIFYSVRTKR